MFDTRRRLLGEAGANRRGDGFDSLRGVGSRPYVPGHSLSPWRAESRLGQVSFIAHRASVIRSDDRVLQIVSVGGLFVGVSTSLPGLMGSRKSIEPHPARLTEAADPIRCSRGAKIDEMRMPCGRLSEEIAA